MAATLTALELERQSRIEANRQRMQQFGLLESVQQIAAGQQQERQERRAQRTASTAARKAAREAARATVGGRPRRSERVAGLDAPNYCENGKLLALADGEGSGSGGTRDRRLLRENVEEEIYGVEHLDALGSHKQPWELFVDGYDANGNRIYDKVNGQTCHQCRQKTLGKRTACAGCQSLQGVLCGDCLFMRYGENVDEVNDNPEWLCPMCRDICNCSFHRTKRRWAPTGTLYRHASAEGYLSVAHYLVLNNLSDDAKPVALERGLCPPTLAEELRKELSEKKADGSSASGSSDAPSEGQPAGSTAAAGEAAAEEGEGQGAQGRTAQAAVEAQLLQAEGPSAAASEQEGAEQQQQQLDEGEQGGKQVQQAGAPMRRSTRTKCAGVAAAAAAAPATAGMKRAQQQQQVQGGESAAAKQGPEPAQELANPHHVQAAPAAAAAGRGSRKRQATIQLLSKAGTAAGAVAGAAASGKKARVAAEGAPAGEGAAKAGAAGAVTRARRGLRSVAH